MMPPRMKLPLAWLRCTTHPGFFVADVCFATQPYGIKGGEDGMGERLPLLQVRWTSY